MTRKTVESIILDRLQSLEDKIDKMHEKIDQSNLDVAELKVKNSLWGGVTGGLTGLAAAVVMIFAGHK